MASKLGGVWVACWKHLGSLLGSLGSLLGASWGLLESLGGLLEPPGGLLGPLGGLLETSWGVLGRFVKLWKRLVRLLGRLVSLLRRLGIVFGGSWGFLESSWERFGKLLGAFLSDFGSLMELKRELESMFEEIKRNL